MALGHGLVLFKPSLAISMVCIGLSKVCYSIQAVEVAILNYDYGYFGKARFELGSCITIAFGLIGAVVGISLSAFTDTHIAVIAIVVIACVEMVVIFFMRERS